MKLRYASDDELLLIAHARLLRDDRITSYIIFDNTPWPAHIVLIREAVEAGLQYFMDVIGVADQCVAELRGAVSQYLAELQ